jgi:tetratricopeptide (TPR) repeat protein
MLNRYAAPRMWTPALSAAVALTAISLAACSGGGDEQKTVSTPVASVPAQVASAPETSGGTVETVVPDYSNVTYEEAESAYTGRRYDEATEMFDSYVNRKPENPWGYYMLGLSSWKSGQLDRAREALEHTLELDPTHVRSLVNLSRVLLEQDRAVEARERIAAALDLDSSSAEVHRM